MNLSILLVQGSLLVLSPAATSNKCSGFSDPGHLTVSSPAQEMLTTVRLDVEGMTCGGCAIAVRKAVRKLSGVKRAEVSYEEHSAVITYDAGKVKVDQIIDAIGRLGFDAKVKG